MYERQKKRKFNKCKLLFHLIDSRGNWREGWKILIEMLILDIVNFLLMSNGIEGYSNAEMGKGHLVDSTKPWRGIDVKIQKDIKIQHTRSIIDLIPRVDSV